MVNKSKLTPNELNLIKRYLLWCYKTTKEELDKIDRYFTQGIVDEFILNDLRKAKEYKLPGNERYKQLVDDYNAYVKKKTNNAQNKKFLGKEKTKTLPEYQYISNRFSAIENAICFYLGDKGLNDIVCLYEKEMAGRILSSREHD